MELNIIIVVVGIFALMLITFYESKKPPTISTKYLFQIEVWIYHNVNSVDLKSCDFQELKVALSILQNYRRTLEPYVEHGDEYAQIVVEKIDQSIISITTHLGSI